MPVLPSVLVKLLTVPLSHNPEVDALSDQIICLFINLLPHMPGISTSIGTVPVHPDP